MDFNFKKLTDGAQTAFTRAKQYTEETLGKSEKTQLDAHFENLQQRADQTKAWTEKLVTNTNSYVQPSPGARLEDYFYDKLQQQKPDRNTNVEAMGSTMIDAGNEFGPGTSYGSKLIKVGQTQLRLGQGEREFITGASTNFLKPLNAFLDTEMKTITKERRTLEAKRLDLDAAKNKLKKAKSADTAAHAEADLRQAQAEFDRQTEITKLLLEGISGTHANHARCLQDFVEAQLAFYTQCHQYMQELQRELSSTSSGSSAACSSSPTAPPLQPGGGGPSLLASSGAGDGGTKKARVMYDYDAADASELSLLADEVISVTLPASNSSSHSADWMLAQRGSSQQGKVPVAYLEFLN